MAWPALIPLILQGVGMAQGAQQGAANKAILKQQGKAASNQSIADASAILREYRQIAGTQAAAIAQNGGGYGGSNAKVIQQSETAAMLDVLNTLYHGETRRRGLNVEGASVANRARTLAGTQALMGLSGAFTQSKTIPTY